MPDPSLKTVISVSVILTSMVFTAGFLWDSSAALVIISSKILYTPGFHWSCLETILSPSTTQLLPATL